MRLSVLLFFVC